MLLACKTRYVSLPARTLARLRTPLYLAVTRTTITVIVTEKEKENCLNILVIVMIGKLQTDSLVNLETTAKEAK